MKQEVKEKHMKLYLAHPISGLSGPQVFEYYDTAALRFKQYFQILSPMTGKDYLRTNIQALQTDGLLQACSTDHAIFQRDSWMVSQCDVVLCDFTGAERISIGCCMELAMAAMLGKHTVVVLPPGNIHKHAFILDAADIVYEDYESAAAYIETLGQNMA
jgi:nucleoside 2-deoxyribosyltransferase